MGRSRSRSPARKERRRSRSRDRDRHHRARQTNRRSRSRSPHHPSSPPARRSRSPDNDDVVFLGTTKGPIEPRRPGRGKRSRNQLSDTVVIDPVDDGSEDVDMMQLMGFSDFNTTKGKHVPGNDLSATNIVQKRKYRQYMNRRGGFNRPLDDVR